MHHLSPSVLRSRSDLDWLDLAADVNSTVSSTLDRLQLSSYQQKLEQVLSLHVHLSASLNVERPSRSHFRNPPANPRITLNNSISDNIRRDEDAARVAELIRDLFTDDIVFPHRAIVYRNSWTPIELPESMQSTGKYHIVSL